MDSMSQSKNSAPAVVRRKYIRTSSKPKPRDQTPDPSSRTQSSQKNTDEESCSSADFFFAAENGTRSTSVSVPTSPIAVTAPTSPITASPEPSKQINDNINRIVMDSMSQSKNSAPAVVRRKYIRTSSKPKPRDQTPDPSCRTQSSQKNTDEESCSSADFFFAAENGTRSTSVSVPTSPIAVTAPTSPITPSPEPSKQINDVNVVSNGDIIKLANISNVTKHPEIEPGGHMSKILSRRSKAMSSKANRSQSTPRKESETQTKTTAIISYASEVPASKRSLSLPRNKEDSSESDAALVARLTIPAPAYQPQYTTNNIDPTDTKSLKLEMNLRKFEEERKKFELEKLRFIQQKKELDRMRLARFEKYKQQIANNEQNKGLSPFTLNVKESGIRPDSPMPKKMTKTKDRRMKMKKYNDYVSSTADSSDYEGSDEGAKLRSRKASKSPRRKPSKSPRRPHSKPRLPPDVMIESPDESNEINVNSIQEFGKALQVRRKPSYRRKSETETEIKPSNGVHLTPEILIKPPQEEEKDKPVDLRYPIFVDAYAHYPDLPKIGVKSYVKPFYYEAKIVWRQLKAAHPTEVQLIRTQFRKCLSMCGFLMILCGLGALAFRHLEGNWESYGHITPKTPLGKALTMVYALIGVPLFLIVLADFGKLLTRIIKFLWAYVRRLYYTGSCRRVRKQTQVQEMMRGINVMYDMVRRPSQMVTTLGVMQTVPGGPHTTPSHASPTPTAISGASTLSRPTCESPTLPDIEIDEEFNLPITLALLILIGYMLIGATVYSTWETSWGFFNAFYFVFISMSTIGFGDYVPEHPIYMMCSIIYLIFGLALTSMCINVVQIKLSDTFRMASAKLGATIGLQNMETASVMEHTPVELASVHITNQEGEGKAEIQEVPPLLSKGETKPEPGRPPKSKFDFSNDEKEKNKSKKKDGKK
uniref:CSON002140 protein n=1 Tax=Culicoides sonorensis TaxID=179676 RepID=A0A336MIQ0_CULSO